MKDELFTTPKEKVEAYRAVYRLTVQALEKGINPRKEFIQMDEMREGKVRLGAFESFVHKVDQGYPKSDMAWLEKCFAATQGSEFTYVDCKNIQLAIDDVVRALEQLREFFAHLETTLAESKKQLDDYLNLADQNKVGSIRYEDFEKMLKDSAIKSSPKELSQMFMILNEFDVDNRIGFDQFKRVMSQELNKYKALRGMVQSGSGPKLATASEAEAAKTLTPLLQGIRRGLALAQGARGSFENYLLSHFKPENQTVSVKDFQTAVRQVYPSTNYVELDNLVKVSVSATATDRVPVGKLDSLIKLSSLQIRSSQTGKQAEDLSKTPVLYKGLEEIGKFAVSKGIAVSEWFVAMDPERTGKLKRTVFENCLHSEDVLATKAEKEEFFKRYKPADAKPGEDTIDYKKFEMEIGIVYPLYAGMIGDTELKVRDTSILLEDIIRHIFTKFAKVTDWAQDNSRGKGYMNMGDLKIAFGKMQPALAISEAEFQKIYITLNPSKAEKIIFYKLEESIMSFAKPLVIEISGKFLNGFDRMKEPLGIKVNNAKAVKKGWISVPALIAIAKEYDDKIYDNNIWLLVRFLDLPLNNLENVKYQDFCTTYFHFLNTNAKLRSEEEIKVFFSSIPPEGHSMIITENKGDGKKTPATEVIPAKMMECVKPFVHTMKQQYKLLTTEDITALFGRLDTDKSGGLNKEEFEAAMQHKFPKTPAKMITEIFKLCDRDQTGNIKCGNFVEFFTKTFPDFENKHDLLYERTQAYQPFFAAMMTSLESQKLKFRDMFEVTNVKLQVAMDTIMTRLKIPNTNDNLRKLLAIFVQDSAVGTLNVDEFQAVAEEYSPKKAVESILENAGKIDTSPSRKNLATTVPTLSPEERKLQSLIEELRKFVRKSPSFSVHSFFDHLDQQGGKDGRGKDGRLSKMELGAFLSKLKKDISPQEIKMLFDKIDTSGDGYLNKDEVAEFFGLHVMIKDQDVLEEVNTGSKWDSTVALIKQGLKSRKYTAESYFDYEGNSHRMNRKDFEMALQVIGVTKDTCENYAGFLLFMQVKNNPTLVDLSKLKLLLDQSSQKNNYASQDAVEIFLWEVLSKFGNDPVTAANAFNPDKSDGISFAEFFINSKYFVKKTMAEEEARSLFGALHEPSETEIRPLGFRYKLMEVMSKYNLTSAPTQVTAPLQPGAAPPVLASGPTPATPKPQMVEFGRFDIFLEGEQSAGPASGATLAMVVDQKMTPEEKKRIERDALFMRIRQNLGHNDAKLLEKLKSQDVKQTNVLNKFYVTETFRKLGCNLDDKEVAMLFEKVVRDKDDPEQIVYLDLVSQIFPNLQELNISTAAELVQTLVSRLHKLRETFDSLWLDMRGGVASVTEITLQDFKYYLNNHGLLLAEEKIKDIFAEFDESRNFKVDVTEFKNKFYGVGNIPTGKKLVASLKNFLTSVGKTTEEMFKPFVDKKDTMDFKGFVKAVEEIKFPIKYLEIEVLFAGLDKDDDKRVSLEEMKAKLDAPVPVVKVDVDAAALRRAIYRFMREKKCDIQACYELMLGKKSGLMSVAAFKDMLTAVGLAKLDMDTEVRPLFSLVDKEGDYQISESELITFMDLPTILLLFPSILQFRTEMLNKLVAEKQQAVVYIRRFDNDGDEQLDEKELAALVKSLGVTQTEEQTKLLLQELDVSGDMKVSAAEIRRILHVEMIDIIEMSTQIQFKLVKSNMTATDAFRQGNRDQDLLLSFAEFYKLIVETLNLNFTVVEVDELFSYTCTTEQGKVQLTEFVALYDRTKTINPFHYNPKYMQSLDEETRKYYFHKHAALFKMTAGPNGMPVMQQDMYKKWDMDRLANDKRFFIVEKESGAQDMPKPPIRKDYIKEKYGDVDDLDIKLVSKMNHAMQQIGITNSHDYFKVLVGEKDRLDYARFDFTLGDLNVKNELGATWTEDQKQKVWKKMHPGEDGKVDVYNFKSYYSAVSLSMGEDKRNDKMILGYVTKIMRIYLIDQQTSLEEVFNSARRTNSSALSMQEFLQIMKRVKDFFLTTDVGKNDAENTVYDQSEFEQLFKFLDKNKVGQLSLNDFKDCIWDYEEFIQKLGQEKELALKKKVIAGCSKLNIDSVFDEFKAQDFKLNSQISISSFKDFFRRHFILQKEEELRHIASLYTVSAQQVDYMKFLHETKLIDETRFALYSKELENSRKTSEIDELAGYIEQKCALQNIPIVEFFSKFDPQNKGSIDLKTFRELVRYVDTQELYGNSDKERMFELIDSNKTQEITKNEFYALILKKHYKDYLLSQFKQWTPEYKQINKALKEKGFKDLQAVYNAPNGCVDFNVFRKHAVMIGLDPSTNTYIEMLRAFEDEEKKGHININTLQKLLDETVRAEPATAQTDTVFISTEMEVGNQSAPAVPPNQQQPRKNRFDNDASLTVPLVDQYGRPVDPGAKNAYGTGLDKSVYGPGVSGFAGPYPGGSRFSNPLISGAADAPRIPLLNTNWSSVVIPETRKFTSEERSIVMKVLANVVNFLDEDGKQPNQVFGRFDNTKSHQISIREFESALYDELYVEPDVNTELFIDYYKDQSTGKVGLLQLYADLEKYKKAKVNRLKFDLSSVRDQLNNNSLSMIPREKLVNYHPPAVDEIVAKKCKQRIELLKTYFRDCFNLSNQRLFEYLYNKDYGSIVKKEFFAKTIDAGFDSFSRDEMNEVFHYIDTNKNDVISLKEFKYHFYDRDYLEKEAMEVKSDLDDELMMLFLKIDEHRTKYVSSEQVVKCLNILGYPATPEMIEVEFKEYDYDKDGRMDFREFKRFMSAKMRSTIFRMNNMVDEIKKKFQKVHPTDGQVFDFQQMATAMASLSPELTAEEVQACFFEADQDQTNFVDLEDIISLVKRIPDETENPLVANAILKLKKPHVLPLKDLANVYQDLPKNFCTAFTRLNFLEGRNLPCEGLYPRMMSSTLGFSDLYGEFNDARTGLRYPVKPYSSKYLRMITLNLASGVPIPVDSAIKREQIKARELRVVLFDRGTHKYIGGTMIFPARWSADYEDRWTFDMAGEEGGASSFWVRAPEETSSLCLLFEFVIFLSHKNVELQMSAAWTSIDLENINRAGSLDLPLYGGMPSLTTQIHSSDVRASRPTFMGKVQKFFSGEIKSELRLKVALKDKLNKFSPIVRSGVDLLPRLIIVPVESVPLWRAYRCYAGRNAYSSGSPNSMLAADLAVKTFLRCVNISSLQTRVSAVWNAHAEGRLVPKGGSEPNYELMIELFSVSMRVLSQTFEADGFHFNRSDQTLELYSAPTELQTRESMVAEGLLRIREVFQGEALHPGREDITYQKPFTIDEMLDDEFLDNMGS